MLIIDFANFAIVVHGFNAFMISDLKSIFAKKRRD
jgi:hypothetical protein